MDGGEEKPFFCDLNYTLNFISKFSMEACPKMSYEVVVQRKKGHILLYHVPKRSKVLKIIDFG